MFCHYQVCTHFATWSGSDWPQTKPKCSKVWSEKVTYLSHLGRIWPTLGPNLAPMVLIVHFKIFQSAVLVWLNYKNAYEYWTEQRMALNKEVLTATRQVMDKLPSITPAAAPAISTLFLQLTVDDLGICVPLLASQYQVRSQLPWIVCNIFKKCC